MSKVFRTAMLIVASWFIIGFIAQAQQVTSHKIESFDPTYVGAVIIKWPSLVDANTPMVFHIIRNGTMIVRADQGGSQQFGIGPVNGPVYLTLIPRRNDCKCIQKGDTVILTQDSSQLIDQEPGESETFTGARVEEVDREVVIEKRSNTLVVNLTIQNTGLADAKGYKMIVDISDNGREQQAFPLTKQLVNMSHCRCQKFQYSFVLGTRAPVDSLESVTEQPNNTYIVRAKKSDGSVVRHTVVIRTSITSGG